jgi:hypothetical protein
MIALTQPEQDACLRSVVEKHGDDVARTQTQRDAWRLKCLIEKNRGTVIASKGQMKQAAGLEGTVSAALTRVRGSDWVERNGWTIPRVNPGQASNVWRLVYGPESADNA